MSSEVSSLLFEGLEHPGFLPFASKPDLLTFRSSLLEANILWQVNPICSSPFKGCGEQDRTKVASVLPMEKPSSEHAQFSDDSANDAAPCVVYVWYNVVDNVFI